MAPVPVRRVEPQIPISTALRSSFWSKLLIFTNFETPPWHRAGTDRGTLVVRARLRVAGHPYHPEGRSGEVVGPRQLSWRIVLNSVLFFA